MDRKADHKKDLNKVAEVETVLITVGILLLKKAGGNNYGENDRTT